MASFAIRNATIDDIPAMYRISLGAHRKSYDGLIAPDYRRAFEDCYTDTTAGRKRYVDIMKSRFLSASWQAWVAAQEGIVIGYTIVCRKDTVLYGKGLFVDPAYQGKGVGTALFGRSVEQSKKYDGMSLVVVERNKSARHLYYKYGFTEVGVAPKNFFGAKQLVMYRAAD